MCPVHHTAMRTRCRAGVTPVFRKVNSEYHGVGGKKKVSIGVMHLEDRFPARYLTEKYVNEKLTNI